MRGRARCAPRTADGRIASNSRTQLGHRRWPAASRADPALPSRPRSATAGRRRLRLRRRADQPVVAPAADLVGGARLEVLALDPGARPRARCARPAPRRRPPAPSGPARPRARTSSCRARPRPATPRGRRAGRGRAARRRRAAPDAPRSCSRSARSRRRRAGRPGRPDRAADAGRSRRRSCARARRASSRSAGDARGSGPAPPRRGRGTEARRRRSRSRPAASPPRTAPAGDRGFRPNPARRPALAPAARSASACKRLGVEALQHLVDQDPEALVDRRLLRDREDARELVLERTGPVEVDVGRRQRQAVAAARDELLERGLAPRGDQLAPRGQVAPPRRSRSRRASTAPARRAARARRPARSAR